MAEMLKSVVLAGLLAGCGGDDLDAAAQGPCSNLDIDACQASSSCQVAFVESPFNYQRYTYLHCLELEGQSESANACPPDHDTCRTRQDCSPIFYQRLGPTDQAVGDPTYERCDHPATVMADNHD